MVVSMIANVNRDPKRRARPYQPKDFMPKTAKERPKELSPEDSVALFRAAFGDRAQEVKAS